MSTHKPDDPSFTPNPDIALNLNAAAAAYAVDTRMESLVEDLLESKRSLKEILFDDTSGGMTKREFVQGFRAWQAVLRAKEARDGLSSED